MSSRFFKIDLYVYLLILSISSCNSSKSQKSIDQMIDKEIAGIIIGNPDSAVEAVGIDKLNQRQILQPLLLANRDNNQVLEIYAHPGDKIYSFREFKIRKPQHGDEVVGKLVKFNNLTSEKGIHLGMSIKELEAKLGKAELETIDEKKVILEYKITQEDKSSYLKKHNSPAYFGKYTFLNNQLVIAHWGLEQL